jgi:hypothetical protein
LDELLVYQARATSSPSGVVSSSAIILGTIDLDVPENLLALSHYSVAEKICKFTPALWFRHCCEQLYEERKRQIYHLYNLKLRDVGLDKAAGALKTKTGKAILYALNPEKHLANDNGSEPMEFYEKCIELNLDCVRYIKHPEIAELALFL